MQLTLSLILSHLKNNFFTYLLAFGIGLAAYQLGQVSGRSQQQDKLDAATKKIGDLEGRLTKAATERQAQAEQSALAMADAMRQWQAAQQTADRLAQELQQTKRRLQTTEKQLKEAIHDAVNSDVGFTGIGPRGLCLYTAALGYPGCDNPVPQATGGTTGHAGEAPSAAGGLSPSGLIEHGVGYGAWCQQLEAQLQKLNQWYDREEK